MVSGTDDGQENRVGKIYDALVREKDRAMGVFAKDRPFVDAFAKNIDKGWVSGNRGYSIAFGISLRDDCSTFITPSSSKRPSTVDMGLVDKYATVGRTVIRPHARNDDWSLEVSSGNLALLACLTPDGEIVGGTEVVTFNYNVSTGLPTEEAGPLKISTSARKIVDGLTHKRSRTPFVPWAKKGDFYEMALMNFSDKKGYEMVTNEKYKGIGHISAENKRGVSRPKYEFEESKGVLQVGLYAPSGLFKEAGDLLVEIDKAFSEKGENNKYSVIMREYDS
jgi:hypothetical protein